MKIKNAPHKKTISLKTVLLSGMMLTASFTCFSQSGVGINATGAAANAAAMLDVTSTTRGVLLPRMTTAQRNAIVAPVVGLTVYNTDLNTFDYYNGVGWVSINPGSGTANYIPKWTSGTTLGNSLIYDNGTSVGIGTSSPACSLDVTFSGNTFIQSKSTTGLAGIILDKGATASNNYVVYRTSGADKWTTGTISNNDFNIHNWASGSDALVINNTTNNVGIGTSSPNAPLQFPNTLLSRKIVLYETANNDNQVYGFGINGGSLRYQVDAPTSDHVFYSGASATTSNELMRIKGNGSVAIGVPGFSSAALNLKGTFMIEDGIGDQVVTIRRGGLHRWQIKEGPSTGLQFGQIYNDAGTATNTTNMEILDNGNVEVYNNLGVGVAPGANYNIYTSRPSDYGADHTGIYSYRNGANAAANGGTSWGNTGVDAALKTFNEWGNNYAASAYFGGFTDFANSAIQMAYNSSNGLFTAAQYRDAGNTIWGLYVQGNASITGSLSKGSGTFKIDHPLDPTNKFLYHSFVESPDMMNIYNGNVITDASGIASVSLPAYFETLNKDFRYQLTVIGEFAQVIVLEKITGNAFKIKTDKPNIEVSWQVTGIRKDPFAEQNRVVPEVEKGEGERGKYLHPAAYGQNESMGIEYTPPGEKGKQGLHDKK
jgi:hypothetical protein